MMKSPIFFFSRIPWLEPMDSYLERGTGTCRDHSKSYSLVTVREGGFQAATSRQQGPMAVYNSEESKPSSLIGEAIDPSACGKSLFIFSLAVQLTFGPRGKNSDRECAVVQIM